MNPWKLCLFLALAFICFAQWEPEKWIPSDAARLSPSATETLLVSICPGHSGESGCDVCPKDTDGGAGKWEIKAVFSGHFVSPSSEDALVSGSGCASHGDDFGGSFLLTKQGPSWHKVRYIAGLIAFDCHKLTGSDGRDRLICGRADSFQGDEYSNVCIHDPGVDLIKTDTPDAQFARGFALDNRGDCFFHVVDTTGGVGKSFQRGFIQRVEFAGIPLTHQTRIIVVARLGRANVPADVVEKGASGTGPKPIIATLPRRYEFVFDGAKVAAAPNNLPVAAPLTSYSVGK
ncbi:MAG: hypothetical protein ABSB15_09380 [Bryobacteraceae bacterium]